MNRTRARFAQTLSAVALLTLIACEEPPIEEQAVRVVVTPAIVEDITLYGIYWHPTSWGSGAGSSQLIGPGLRKHDGKSDE